MIFTESVSSKQVTLDVKMHGTKEVTMTSEAKRTNEIAWFVTKVVLERKKIGLSLRSRKQFETQLKLLVRISSNRGCHEVGNVRKWYKKVKSQNRPKWS